MSDPKQNKCEPLFQCTGEDDCVYKSYHNQFDCCDYKRYSYDKRGNVIHGLDVCTSAVANVNSCSKYLSKHGLKISSKDGDHCPKCKGSGARLMVNEALVGEIEICDCVKLDPGVLYSFKAGGDK